MDVGLYSIFGGHQVDIVPHVFEHYMDQGIDPDNFFIAYHDNPVFPELKEKYFDHFDKFGIQPKFVFGGELSTYTGKWPLLLDKLRSMSRTKWMVRIDMDELHEYPNGLDAIVSDCDNYGYDYVIGVWVDRLDVDGVFKKIERDVSLWEQFPLVLMDYARLDHLFEVADKIHSENAPYFIDTKKYRPRGSKMALARTVLPHTQSSHVIDDVSRYRRFPKLAHTHHFKFSESCVVHCELMADNKYSESRLSVLDKLEYDKEKNSINMELVRYLIQTIETPKPFYINDNFPSNLPEPSWL